MEPLDQSSTAVLFVGLGGKRTYLWRAVDDEGEVLEVLAQSRRNKRAALKLMRKLMKKQGNIPDKIVTDKLGSYSAALRELGLAHHHVTGGRLNNRAKVSHQPTRRRERRMGRFKPGATANLNDTPPFSSEYFSQMMGQIDQPNAEQFHSKYQSLVHVEYLPLGENSADIAHNTSLPSG